MKLLVYESLEDIRVGQWNALYVNDNPFLRHEFLAALERNVLARATAGGQDI